MFNDSNPARHGSSALASLRSALGPEALARSSRIAHIKEQHVANPNDRILDRAMSDIMEEQEAFLAGPRRPEDAAALKTRALFIVGDSGSGKSTAIARAWSRRPGFMSGMDEKGKPTEGFAVSYVAPKPSTPKLLATTGLHAIGYPLVRPGQENEMWALLRQQIAELQKLWLHIDEMQHVVRSSGHSSARDVADIVKNLLQLETWPLACIFSGVNSLGAFLSFDDNQLGNRCRVIRFEPIRMGAGTRTAQRIVGGVITKHAGMTAEEVLATEDFANRLIQASRGAFGTAIQLVREAVFHALRHARERVTLQDFIAIYRAWTGCLPGQNPFSAPDPSVIDPAKAMNDCLVGFRKEVTDLRDLMQGLPK